MKGKNSILNYITALSFAAAIFIFSSPGAARALPYAPGETLDPACTPGAANCTITGSWLFGGNTLSASGTLGTLSANDLNFITSSATRLTMLSSGNVGINTTTPAYSLEVKALAAVNPFNIASSSGSSVFQVLSDGNILIGTSTISGTAPVGSLAIAGKFYGDGSALTGISIPASLARNLNGPGVAAKCQAGVAAAAFSLPSSNAPAATCESDGIQAYLSFATTTAQTAYDRFELPVDWTGTMKLVLSTYSTSANTPTVNLYLSCQDDTGSTINPTFGSANAVSLTTNASSNRKTVTTTLTTDAGHATKACAAGDTVEWKLTITGQTNDLRVLSVRFTE